MTKGVNTVLDVLIDEVDKVMPKHEATPTCLTWDGWYLGISDCRSDVLFLLSSCLVLGLDTLTRIQN